jgi:hypothetical protein
MNKIVNSIIEVLVVPLPCGESLGRGRPGGLCIAFPRNPFARRVERGHTGSIGQRCEASALCNLRISKSKNIMLGGGILLARLR